MAAFLLESPDNKSKRPEPHLFAIIQAAGWPIWPLLLASVIAVALIIERSVTLRSSKIIPPTLLEQVLAVYQRQGVTEEILDKLAKDSPLGEVLAAGLRNHKSSRYVMKDAIEEAGRTVAHELERFLTTLGTIATAAPLLGLFGTVIGMIEIFGSQSPTRRQPAAAGARHLDRAVQHRLRHRHRHSRADLLPPLQEQGGRLRRRHGAAGGEADRHRARRARRATSRRAR